MVLRESIATKTAIVLTACLFREKFAKKAPKMATWHMRGPSGALSCGCLYQARGGGGPHIHTPALYFTELPTMAFSEVAYLRGHKVTPPASVDEEMCFGGEASLFP
jgi:hypothetical protein